MGDSCDPKLKSAYKLKSDAMDTSSNNEDIFEVTICREQKVNQDKFLREFQSYSKLSSQKPLTYPKLDIRNFYLEKQTDMDHETNAKMNDESKNEQSYRMFSYIAHLQNTMKNETTLLRK